MVTKFSTEDFGPKFDEAIARVEDGDDVVVQRDGEEVARIVAPRHKNGHGPEKVIFGSARGVVHLADGWDAALAESEITEWEDGAVFPGDNVPPQ